MAAVAALAARMLTAFTVQTGVVVGTDVAAAALVHGDHDPFGHLELAADVEGGLVGAVAMPLGVLAGAGARVLPEAVAAGRMGSVLLDAASFGASAALVERAFDGSVDPGEVAFAAVGAGVGSLAGRALRRTGTGTGAGAVHPGPVPPIAPAAVGETLPPHLRAVFEASTPVPSGRSFFSARDDTWLARLVPRVPAQPGRAVVFLHGNRLSVRAAGRSLSPEELAAVVRADPALAGKPVTLFACETGRLDDGFAARLARELGVEVVAPTELAWLAPDGTMYTTSGRLLDDGWLQTVPHDGHWRRFPPPAVAGATARIEEVPDHDHDARRPGLRRPRRGRATGRRPRARAAHGRRRAPTDRRVPRRRCRPGRRRSSGARPARPRPAVHGPRRVRHRRHLDLGAPLRYYVERHGLAPEPELLAHIRASGYRARTPSRAEVEHAYADLQDYFRSAAPR